MRVGDALRKSLEFWHWYPQLLCEGLSDDQLHWQPDAHPNHIMFAMWHVYRCEDDIIHGLLMQKPGVFASGGWAQRLPVAEPGNPPFGTGLNREQIAAIRLRLDDLLEYTGAVCAAIQSYADSLTEEEAAQQVSLPILEETYPVLQGMNRVDLLAFLCIGHVAEHLGEVQYIKGLMGLQGAPL
jgi:hypothetical protein